MTLKTSLLPHQQAAVDKLRRLKVGALYMEMGTGKTRTALELIKLRLDAGRIDAVLWLCPCSVKGNLLADIRRHSDLADLPGLLTVCGIETLSTSVRANSELRSLVSARRVCLIVDESSLVKNPNALRSRNITRLAERCGYKLILNGTPVTKFEADLYSQWAILDWRILGYRSFYSFAANHLEYDQDRPGRIVRALNVDYLARKIEPYTFQCRKDEVMELPDKVTEEEPFWMTEEQEALYQRTLDVLLTDLDDMSDTAIYRLFGALQSIVSGFDLDISPTHKVTRRPMFADPEDNPRIRALLDAVDRIPPEDKVLIFCTYTREIHDVAACLEARWPGQTAEFYGAVPQAKRQARLDEFRESRRFLVANKACGAFGLNLQFCHRLIFYSHDWNWGTRAQAEDRVHRLGQAHEVQITNILARESIDGSILQCLARKENLADRFKAEVGRQSMENFLRGGKHGKNLSEAKRVRGRAGTA